MNIIINIRTYISNVFLAILLFDDISSTKLLLLTKLVTAVQRKNLRHTLQQLI